MKWIINDNYYPLERSWLMLLVLLEFPLIIHIYIIPEELLFVIVLIGFHFTSAICRLKSMFYNRNGNVNSIACGYNEIYFTGG